MPGQTAIGRVPEVFSHVLGDTDRARFRLPHLRAGGQQLAADAALGVGAAVVWFAAFEVGRTHGWRPVDPRTWLVAGTCLGVAVAVRRIGSASLFIVLAVAYPLVYARPLLSYFHLLPLLVLGYAGAQASGRRSWAAVAVVAACALSVGLLISPLMWDSPFGPGQPFRLPGPQPRINLSDLALAEFATISVALLGTAIASQRTAARDLAERNAELERLRRSDADRAVAEERLRISREVHDVVAHHLTAILMRAQAADRVHDTRPDEAQRAVAWIAAESREALRSTRLTVSTLRNDSPDSGSNRGDGALADDVSLLVDRVRQVGLQARLSMRWEAEPRLSPQVGVAVRRTVQEALTNVLKHAHATEAQVVLQPEAGGLGTWIIDNGRAGSSSAVPGAGAGLAGMQERAEACGGRLAFGPPAEGGWRVHLWVPVLSGGEP